jgi:hypothetical protein
MINCGDVRWSVGRCWDDLPGAGSEGALWLAKQNSAAKAVWREIQERMKPPLCKGHSEPCVIRQVKKGGPNQGKSDG